MRRSMWLFSKRHLNVIGNVAELGDKVKQTAQSIQNSKQSQCMVCCEDNSFELLKLFHKAADDK